MCVCAQLPKHLLPTSISTTKGPTRTNVPKGTVLLGRWFWWDGTPEKDGKKISILRVDSVPTDASELVTTTCLCENIAYFFPHSAISSMAEERCGFLIELSSHECMY